MIERTGQRTGQTSPTLAHHPGRLSRAPAQRCLERDCSCFASRDQKPSLASSIAVDDLFAKLKKSRRRRGRWVLVSLRAGLPGAKHRGWLGRAAGRIY